MSDSNNHRNPFTDDAADQDTIARLVAEAAQTHREPEESTRKRHRYPTEDRRSKITVDLDPDTIAQLREIAQREGVGKSVSKVVQALLDYALEAYESGDLEFELRPAATRYRLEVMRRNVNEN